MLWYAPNIVKETNPTIDKKVSARDPAFFLLASKESGDGHPKTIGHPNKAPMRPCNSPKKGIRFATTTHAAGLQSECKCHKVPGAWGEGAEDGVGEAFVSQACENVGNEERRGTVRLVRVGSWISKTVAS